MPRSPLNKTRFIGVRLSMPDAEELRTQAGQCGLTVSELVRRRVTGQPVISRTDEDTAARVDRLGRMLKHLYPKDKSWASPEDRKRWWSLVTELERTAKMLCR